VRNGKIEIRPMMTITLNFDHRMIDGAPAARFLQDVKSLLEGGLEQYVLDEQPQTAHMTKAKVST
jgi:pyruvate dehydrogenase E2 component (dihydrolipoamide acetyltransferase)